jgi:hypothetical protein
MSAASLSGALKQLIESADLGVAAYRDDAGAAAVGSRWVTIAEDISTVTDRLGDDGADDPVTELVQVDLWQPWRATAEGGAAEDYDLADQLHRTLHGAALDAPMLVRSCKVDDVQRFVERDANLVHHAFTVRIRRDRFAAPTP